MSSSSSVDVYDRGGDIEFTNDEFTEMIEKWYGFDDDDEPDGECPPAAEVAGQPSGDHGLVKEYVEAPRRTPGAEQGTCIDMSHGGGMETSTDP